MSQDRTGGMTAVAVLNFVFAALQIGGGLFAVLAGHAALSRAFTTSEVRSTAMQSIGLGILLVLVGSIGVVAGAATLKLIPWGRLTCLVYAALTIFSNVANFLVNIGIAGNSKVGAIVGFLFWLIYPIVLILLCSTLRWKEAFGQAVTSPATHTF